MTFKNAAAFIMPFGKHRGKTLDAIASTDDGLQYLDWLRGERESKGQPPFVKASALNEALAAYLDDPAIRRELDK